MPKVSKLQATFNAGEISPLVYGRVDSQRYKAALATCLNYIPTLQGPLIRRPGTKYVATVKDSSNAPALIPFQYSATQAYVLELGNFYMRFYASGGQVIASSNVFKVAGYATNGGNFNLFGINALRASAFPQTGETFTGTSLVAAGSILEMVSPYAAADVANVKFAQTSSLMYLTHPNYPPYKLIFNGPNWWDLKRVAFRDGPYLPLNSYSSIGDSTGVTLVPAGATIGAMSTGPVIYVSSAISSGSSGMIRLVTQTAHGHSNGDQIFVTGVVGTTEANNNTSAIATMQWTASVVDTTHIDLQGSVFVNAYVGSGIVFPALFQPTAQVPSWQDIGRNVRLIPPTGSSVWGYIASVSDPAHCVAITSGPNLLTNFGGSSFWQLGVWRSPLQPSYFPSATCFHQNRLIFTGAPNVPQEVDGSFVGDYENFAANDINTLQVAANNALQFTLNASESNTLKWLKSTSQGLLAGSQSSEWAMAPATTNEALTPTNFNATQCSFYGSANVDAVQIGNGTLYVNKTGRKVRELNYFFQLGTFRSTDLSELSEHLTIPSVIKLVVQKETQPLIWAANSSGTLTAMVYNRDDLSLQAGWARQQLGGASDSAGTPPQVLSMAVIPSVDTSFDQVWLVTNRWINGAKQVSVEYVTKVFDDSVLPEDAITVDCASTYDSPITITGLTNATAAVVSASAHGFSNGDSVRIVGVNGLVIKTTDINGNITLASQVNAQTFQVGSSVTNSFNLLDFSGNAINTNSSTVYINGGQARKLVTTISGLTNLKNETVGVWADGSYHPDITIASSGVATLQYPAAKVQFGYRYNSDGATLTTLEGSAQGSAVGSMRRINRYAFLLHNVGDLQVGSNFNNLIPTNFNQADQQLADQAVPLFSGMIRDGVESEYELTDKLCFRQNSPAPGMIQSLTLFLEEQDV